MKTGSHPASHHQPHSPHPNSTPASTSAAPGPPPRPQMPHMQSVTMPISSAFVIPLTCVLCPSCVLGSQEDCSRLPAGPSIPLPRLPEFSFNVTATPHYKSFQQLPPCVWPGVDLVNQHLTIMWLPLGRDLAILVTMGLSFLEHLWNKAGAQLMFVKWMNKQIKSLAQCSNW